MSRMKHCDENVNFQTEGLEGLIDHRKAADTPVTENNTEDYHMYGRIVIVKLKTKRSPEVDTQHEKRWAVQKSDTDYKGTK